MGAREGASGSGLACGERGENLTWGSGGVVLCMGGQLRWSWVRSPAGHASGRGSCGRWHGGDQQDSDKEGLVRTVGRFMLETSA